MLEEITKVSGSAIISPEGIANPAQELVIPKVLLRQDFPQQKEEKEIKMAEVDTTVLQSEHGAIMRQIGAEACGINTHIGDSRREAEKGFADTRYDVATRAGDIRHELATGFCDTNRTVMQEGQDNMAATKDARYDLADRITNSGDRVSDRLMELRGLTGQRFHEISHDLATVLQGQATLAKDVELNALKTQLDAQKNTTYLADKVAFENEKTRDLINDLKYHDLNRSLVERNTELVECEADRRHWRHTAGQTQYAAQWAQLQNQVQAFQSQLQETRQGMVNFGTMAGVGQTSTSNNVR